MAVAPDRVTVEVGSSNDSETEIVSGLTEGQVIVTRTVTATAAATTTGGSGIPGLGGFGGAGATVRVQGAGGMTGGGNATFRRSGG